MSFVGVHLAGCIVLVVAGLAKAARPDELAAVLGRLVRVTRPSARRVVRFLAAIETVVGVTAFLWPAGAVSLLVAASYVSFTAYVAYLRWSDEPIASCGCFGTPDTPATRAHIVVTATFAIAALGAALAPVDGGIIGVLRAQPGAGLPLMLGALVVAGLAVAVLTRHAEVQSVRAMYVEAGTFASEASAP